MRNSSAIAQLIAASEAADDPLDRLACRRAAAWLRWCDGYGATLTEPEAARISAGGSLAEAARGLIRRLSETYPAPVEDARLDYLENEDDSSWSTDWQRCEQIPRPRPIRTQFVKDVLSVPVDNPFSGVSPVAENTSNGPEM